MNKPSAIADRPKAERLYMAFVVFDNAWISADKDIAGHFNRQIKQSAGQS